MSGRTKRILYRIFDLTLWLAAFACTGLIYWNAVTYRAHPMGGGCVIGYVEALVAICVVVALMLRMPVIFHELGHLLFGLFAGMNLAYFRVSLWGGITAGATEMFPKNGKRVRTKFLLFAFGGAVLNFIIGVVFLVLYYFLDYHPALLFFGMLAPFILYEGIRSLIPVELNAGKTDGAIIFGLIKKCSEEEIMLRVLTAQGILYRGSFADISRELLFDVPVVRADHPAYHALLFLRMQYELNQEKSGEARAVLEQLHDIEEYLSGPQREEFLRYAAYFEGKFEIKKQLLKGVNDLEKKLKESITV